MQSIQYDSYDTSFYIKTLVISIIYVSTHIFLLKTHN